jgi:hypothetical protein
MLRTLRASTPVDSLCEVVRIVGIVFSLSWNVAQVLLAELAVVGGDALAVMRVGVRLDLVDVVPDARGVVLGGAEDQGLLALVDLVHEFVDAAQLALVDDERVLKSASVYSRSGSISPATTSSPSLNV